MCVNLTWVVFVRRGNDFNNEGRIGPLREREREREIACVS